MNAALIINQIETCFYSIQLRDWLLRYQHLLQQNNDPQSFTYIGINFKDEQLHSLKFYAHTFLQVSEEQAVSFIPHTNDFIRYNKNFTTGNQLSLRNAGVAFELKYKHGNDTPVEGFFSHVQNIQLLSKKQPLATIDLNKAASGGINFEYSLLDTLTKNYYYFTDSTTNENLKKLFHVPYLPLTGLYEYSFASNFAKLNVYGWDAINEGVIQQHFSKTEQEVILHFNQKYNFQNPGIGVYLNQPIKSVYFFADKILSNPVDKMPIHSDAIRKVLEKIYTH